jgi:cellulose synthase/poly-beta-1,6-N-acetylglucosamine synthase-like glycosyltransferase
MSVLPSLLLGGAGALAGYTYVGYPVLLKLLGGRRPTLPTREPAEWPSISITVPAYNEAGQIRETLESLLAIDYPADRRQILVVSDASTDGTDEIVAEFADRGVELLRMPQRMGKTAAENAARPQLRGEIIVNTDASIRILPRALRPLIRALLDPAVGLASGRDVSVAPGQDHSNAGEGGYVGYEMWVRSRETRVGGIVGASGCFYAIRAPLHHGNQLPDGLSRDFAAALVTHEHGYRAVSVDAAVCLVPRSPSLRREYARKVRTMARGLQTLFYKRHLLDPTRHGIFAWMLFSHKLCRWLVPWAAVGAGVGLLLLAQGHAWARWTIGVGATVAVLGAMGWARSEAHAVPRLFSVPAYLLAGNVAALHAWVRAVRGRRDAFWVPTRREAVPVR